MGDILKVIWNDGRGGMMLDIDRFFPVTQEHFYKLLKVIDLDYKHREDILQRLTDNFCERIKELDKELPKLREVYDNAKSDYERARELTGRRKSATRVQKKEIAENALSNLKDCERKKKSYEGHLKKLE